MTHTPGPWRVNLHHTKTSAGRNYGFVMADGIVPIAAVTLGVEGVAEDEGRANAALIAAAPDLLAALQLVWDTYGFDPSIDSAIWQTVRAAIARATGETK